MDSKKTDQYRNAETGFLKAYGLHLKERWVRVEELGINVRVLIIGQGKPLLFIHGGPAAASLWLQLVSFIKDYSCVLLDRPGCGLSESISYNNLSRDRLSSIITSVIDAVLDKLQIERLPVIASSFGGYLSMLYTRHHPGRFSKMVLEGCPAMIEEMKTPPFMRAMLFPGLKWLFSTFPATKTVFRQILKGMGHGNSVNNNLIPDAFIEWYISLFNCTGTLKNELSLVSKALPFGTMNPSFILHDSDIEKIEEPVLLLWGKDDPFGSCNIGQRLHSRLRNSSIECFEKSGHLPWIDQPETHARLIIEFCSSEEKNARHINSS